MRPSVQLNLFVTGLVLSGGLALADDQISFSTPGVLSVEGLPGSASPGQAASDVKLLRLFTTPGGIHDGRLVAVYLDANTTNKIWHPRDGTLRARDVFLRYSDDDGTTWSNPVNLSNTAGSYSSATDWSGDGVPEPYWGDSGEATLFSSGDNLVVSWTDKYCPEVGWTFGDSGLSSVQGSAVYPGAPLQPGQPEVAYPEHEVAYSGIYLAVSNDGGTTWIHGGGTAPLQLTYGRRDALLDLHHGSGSKWVVTWQEDPEGLQPSGADDPGQSYNGAEVSVGTDTWYAYTTDIVNDAVALRTNRTPLSNQSAYDVTLTNGFPTALRVGIPEKHGSSRADLALVLRGTKLHAVVAYEETKGHPSFSKGKTIQYHSFPFDQPYKVGPSTFRHGTPGMGLTDPLENSRQVRFVARTPNGITPAVTLIWRQGPDHEGASADIMLKASLWISARMVESATTLNMSSNTPLAKPFNLGDDTGANPDEDARDPCVAMVGESIAIGYCYTPNAVLARYTTLENYNFWLRCSHDGGLTWVTPTNLSGITDMSISVLEPLIIEPADTGVQDTNVLVAGWSTERNGDKGQESYPLDTFVTRTADFGNTFSKVVRLCATDLQEFDSHLCVDDDATEVYGAGMQTHQILGTTNAFFTLGSLVDVPDSVGTLFCFGDGSGAACPCGNESDAAVGCANSSGTGAQLIAGGSVSLSSKNLTLEAFGVTPHQPALLVSSPTTVNGALGYPFGDGLLCLGPPMLRLGVRQVGASGIGVWAQGFVTKFGYMAGETHFFQVWYRDPSGPPCGAGGNLTNGVEVSFVP